MRRIVVSTILLLGFVASAFGATGGLTEFPMGKSAEAQVKHREAAALRATQLAMRRNSDTNSLRHVEALEGGRVPGHPLNGMTPGKGIQMSTRSDCDERRSVCRAVVQSNVGNLKEVMRVKQNSACNTQYTKCMNYIQKMNSIKIQRQQMAQRVGHMIANTKDSQNTSPAPKGSRVPGDSVIEQRKNIQKTRTSLHERRSRATNIRSKIRSGEIKPPTQEARATAEVRKVHAKRAGMRKHPRGALAMEKVSQ